MTSWEDNGPSLWVERYRPKKLDDFVGAEDLKEIFEDYIEKNDMQNVIFYGPAGTGKTTLAKILALNLDCEYIYINASNERGIDTIRDKVINFASVMVDAPLKLIILDEADFLTMAAQASLRNVIEQYSDSTRFIMTCNYPEKIIEAIKSRCLVIEITPPKEHLVLEYLEEILEKEEIKYNRRQVAELIRQTFPDIRRAIGTLQLASRSGRYRPPKTYREMMGAVDNVIEELKNDQPKIAYIRQMLLDSGIKDFSLIYRSLYERVDEFTKPELVGRALILLADYQYKGTHAVDQEINTAALIQQLINNR